MLDWLLPRRCILCRGTGASVCVSCLSGLPPAPDLAPPPGFDRFGSLLSYEGDTRRLIASIKFDGRRDAVAPVARVLAELVDWDIDSVTWAPTSARRRRRRGFDQAELIARSVSRELGVGCVATLRRAENGHQTGRSRSERLGGVEFTRLGPSWRIGSSHSGRSKELGAVLVVDDVRTTGATLCAAGDTLLCTGAQSVSALTLAVTL